MKNELPKAYDPKQYEDAIYTRWEQSGFFSPDTCIEKGITEKDSPYFSIVLPPPNVTGTLHMGHAVMLAIEDAMVRYHRMKGDRTLWVPGTDHAAIATQEKVEKILWNEEKKTRHDLGRDAFLKRVEQFAQESHDTIVNQSKKMGASLDWSREAYTLDDARNLAVRTAFKRMYDEGLIYRGDRIVNWDPKMQSTVSDIEVDRVEGKAPFYYFQYGPFVIGTSRPETKFGDKYVVMHPEDERYKEYKDGDTFECEWINGKIIATIIKDEAVDPAFGSGVMTITPWHDATDFFMAERHGLDKEQVIDFHGKLLPIAGEFAGMSIEDARSKIVEKLQRKGLLVRTDEEYLNSKAVNSRGGGTIEPQIMRQWWINVNKEFVMRHSGIKGIKSGDTVTLKKLMQHVVREGEIEIIPEQFKKIYFNWVDNLLDWCISRQIWYGHRIPAWHKGEEVFVGVDAPEGEGWQQDPDTLDTWFSSGLWTFSTLGWPAAAEAMAGKPNDEAEDFKKYHPTSVLETGYDILTFWVVRMILMTTYLTGSIPFKTVYLHGMVRDEHGKKMSKSLGNIIDPLDMIEKYGTDATRLSLMIGSTPGNDMKLSEEKVAGFRNFTNKLWNISRFILTQTTDNGPQSTDDGSPSTVDRRPQPKTDADAWILSELNELVAAVTNDMETFAFSAAGERLREFTWSKLADWYLEVAKVEGEKNDILNYILNTLLKLWHPFMPFVTEAIWKEVYGEENMLLVEKWPVSQVEKTGGMNTFSLVQDVITAVRSLRAEYRIEPSQKIIVFLSTDTHGDVLERNATAIRALGHIESLTIGKDLSVPPTAVTTIANTISVSIDMAGAVDTEKEKTRLQKELDKLAPYVTSLERKLSNAEFVNNAPATVVEGEKKKLAEAEMNLEKVKEQLQQLN